MKTTDTERSSNKKILIISSLGPRPYVGGIENVIDTTLNSNLRKRYIFEVFDTHRSSDPKRNHLKKILYACTLLASSFKCVFTSKPDIVHIHFCSKVDFWKHSICLVTANFLGVPTFFHLHGGSFDQFYLDGGFFRKYLIRRIFRIPDKVIVLSHYWLDFLSPIVSKSKLVIIPNPIDCALLSMYSQKYGSDSEKSLLLIGSLGKRKGHFDVLKALKLVLIEFPDIQLYFAGNDEDVGATSRLKEITHKDGLANNVHFLGPVSGKEKLKLLGRVSIVLLPSYAENMPISVLEGMAAKKPVISSNVGAIPELFENNKYGELVEPGDWTSLSSKIINLLANVDYSNALGERGFERVKENLDVGIIASLLDVEYKKEIKIK